MKPFLLILLILKTLPVQALDLPDIAWQTQQQIAKKHYDSGRFEQAAELFDDKLWQANSLYKAGKFAAAADIFQELKQDYNFANALTQQKKYDEAIKIYKKIAKSSADYADAKYNLRLVKQLQKQKQKQQKKSKNGKKDSKKDDKNGKKDSKKDGKKNDKNGKKDDKKNGKKNDKKDDKNGKKNGKKDSKKDDKAKREMLKQQINKQRLMQIFKQVETKPIDLLKQKFLNEQYLRKQHNSKLSNTQGQISW